MIQPATLTLSLIAACLYGAVAASCLLASMSAAMRRQARWHVIGWSIIAALFVALGVMRLFAFEDLLREDLRAAFRNQGAYDDRRELQGPVFAALFIAAASFGGFWAFRISRAIGRRRDVVSMIAIGFAFAMAFLFMFRIVSLHSVDQLLYGPLKLNWIIDIGSSVAVLACGVYYWRVVTGKG